LNKLKQLCPLAFQVCTAKAVSAAFASVSSSALVLEVESHPQCGTDSETPPGVRKAIKLILAINMVVVKFICLLSSTRKKLIIFLSSYFQNSTYYREKNSS
jgi:hypothetical protein